MTRTRIFSVSALAIIAGGTLAYGTHDFLQNVPVRTISVRTQPVVTAASALRLGTEVASSDLRVVAWPADSVPHDTFTDPQDIVGRGLMASLVMHEPILESKLAPKGAGAGLPPIIPAGQRAISVRVNEVIGVAGYVLPGTRVDVVATAMPTSAREDTTSKVVLTNVEVLTAGTRLEKTHQDPEPQQLTVVTLLVTPEQAERLALASTEGKIQLALRNPLDESAPETPGVRAVSLLRGTPAPPRPVARTARVERPAPPPPAPLTVEVIRGDQRAIEIVK